MDIFTDYVGDWQLKPALPVMRPLGVTVAVGRDELPAMTFTDVCRALGKSVPAADPADWEQAETRRLLDTAAMERWRKA